jgi:hypothetical protein
MASGEKDILRSCGRFFGSLAAVSIGLAGVQMYNGRWAAALSFVPGMILFGGLAWFAFSDAGAEQPPGPAPGAGTSEAGKPVPVGPKPIHHLIAAKDLPPADKTHSYPHD